MTYRELLLVLSNLSETQLDMEAVAFIMGNGSVDVVLSVSIDDHDRPRIVVDH